MKEFNLAKEPSIFFDFEYCHFLIRKIYGQPRNLDYTRIHFRSGRAQIVLQYFNSILKFCTTEAIVETVMYPDTTGQDSGSHPVGQLIKAGKRI